MDKYELRMADPTLTALWKSDEVWQWRVHVCTMGGVTWACAFSDTKRLRCGRSWIGETGDTPTAYARWFAVPCRDCFPDAPPPGRIVPDEGDGITHYADPHLAWQVTS